MPYLMGVI